MKKFIITEKQSKLLMETMGLPDAMMYFAKEIVDELMDDVFSIYYEYSELEKEQNNSYEDDEDYGYWKEDPWDDLEKEYNFDTNFGEVTVYIEYGEPYGSQASTDYENITINFRPIKNRLDKLHQDAEDLDKEDFIFERGIASDEIRQYLNEIVIHELTHILNGGVMDNDSKWLNYFGNRYIPQEDIREFLALFSQEEMNSRIASAGMKAKEVFNEESVKTLEMYSHYDTFKDVIDDFIIDEKGVYSMEDTLLLRSMETNLSVLKHNELDFKVYKDLLKRKNGKPYSLAYCLFRNDSRLKNNRKLKYLFNVNFNAGAKYVCDFYTKKLEEFKNRIYKVCWGALTSTIKEKQNENGIRNNIQRSSKNTY